MAVSVPPQRLQTPRPSPQPTNLVAWRPFRVVWGFGQGNKDHLNGNETSANSNPPYQRGFQNCNLTQAKRPLVGSNMEAKLLLVTPADD
eukprot:1513415-Amphidinium_carterae.1